MPKRVKITEDDLPVQILEATPWKVTSMGNVTEVQCCSYRNNKQYIKVLPDKKYIYLPTGEVKDFQSSETRADQTGSLRRTFKRLRELINCNTEQPKNCRFLTLTYEKNMTDRERLYDDFRKFNMRFCYWCKTEGIGKPEYISVVEPQARGAWHCHVIYIWDKEAPYISNATLADLWRYGFVRVTALHDCNNVGAYLTAYLADIPLKEAEPGQVGELKEVDGKKYIKGGRLSMYPPGMNLYRTSRGIKKPVVEYYWPGALDVESFGGLTHRSTIKIEFETGHNTYIDTRYYNKRK